MISDGSDDIAAVYANLFRGIYGYCAYRLFKKDLAEDVASAVFLRLAEKWPLLKDKSEIELRNWLYGTARNFAAKCLNDERRSKEILADCARIRGVTLGTEPAGDSQSEWAMLYEAIRKLPAQDQEVIALRYSRGLDSMAIGKILGLRPGTVRVRLLRVLRKLREQVGKKGQ